MLPFGCSLAAGTQGECGICDSFFLAFYYISHFKVTGLYTWAGFPGCGSPMDPAEGVGVLFHGICGVSPSHGKSLVIFALRRRKFGAWTLPRGVQELLGAGREWKFLENPGITGIRWK